MLITATLRWSADPRPSNKIVHATYSLSSECHLSTPSSSLRRITMTVVLRNLFEVLHLRDLECIHRRARIIIILGT